MIVVPAEELTPLVAAHLDIGAVEIQHDFLWRLLVVLLSKVVPEQLMGFNNGLPLHRLFHPIERGFADQNGDFSRGGL